jgi:hypothetical protein
VVTLHIYSAWLVSVLLASAGLDILRFSFFEKLLGDSCTQLQLNWSLNEADFLFLGSVGIMKKSASLLYRLVNTNPGQKVQRILLVAGSSENIEIGPPTENQLPRSLVLLLVAWIAQHASLLRLYILIQIHFV